MRWYSIKDGDTVVRLPSVTTVLDVTMPQQRRDTLVRAEMASPTAYSRRRADALSRGLLVDGWVKRCMELGRAIRPPHPVERQCRRLLPLVRSILTAGGDRFVDQQVHSILGYAGTLDLLATLPTGQRAVVELKTSAYTIWPEAIAEAQLQAAAYAMAWNEQHPEAPAQAIATYHATPYMVHGQLTFGPALNLVSHQWLQRLRQFSARYSQLDL